MTISFPWQAYRGTQSDFHTHVHDLPPQMGSLPPPHPYLPLNLDGSVPFHATCVIAMALPGGCFESGEAKQQRNKQMVDAGPWEVHS